MIPDALIKGAVGASGDQRRRSSINRTTGSLVDLCNEIEMMSIRSSGRGCSLMAAIGWMIKGAIRFVVDQCVKDVCARRPSCAPPTPFSVLR